MDLRRSLLLLGLACHLAARGCAAASGCFFFFPHRPPAGPRPPLPLFQTEERALPELDGCQRAVLGELTLSCSDISEEHLSKLGVALFNCRAAAEHRPTYPCTPGMALSDCTQGMDPATKNAYHMMRNHARALCHAARQQHVRPRAETTANCSAHAPSPLLEVMDILKDGQAELRELTAASLEKLVNSQKLLLLQQEQLEAWRQDVESSINANLEKLAQGREVPAGGHQLMAERIEGIALTVDNVSEQLVHQDLQLHQGQQTILAHLLDVGARLHQLDAKLEWKLALFAAHQSQTAVRHEQLEKLQKMNETVGTVRHVLGHLEQGESPRPNTLQHFLNCTGRDVHVMYTCVVHTGCFLAAAVITTFLQTPGFSRAVLLVLVLLNALSQLNHCASLDLTSLSAFLTLTLVGNWMLMNRFGSRMRTSVWTPVLQRPGFFTSTPERKCPFSEWGDECEKMDRHSLQGSYALETTCFIRGSPLMPAPVEAMQPTTNPAAYSFKVPAPLMAFLPRQHPPPLPNCAQWEAAEKNSVGEDHRLPHHSRVFEAETFILHDPAGSTGSPSRRLPCCGITRTGQRCRNKAASGREFCRVHSSEQTLACR